MARCPSCASEVPEASRFCLSCGSALGSSAPTQFGAKQPTPQSSGPAPSSSSFDEGRFIPGTLLAGRYRIVGLLGRGGMGEVYRANDLKLGQPVALKFLPHGLVRDAAMLARFHGEVRVARQVSHPNVCRVYDIGETDGQHYISMEYVDGEDLASLLRRIGRLPQDKALEMARQLCAGLAAAHEKGVLHRDLKPANILVDGRGKVLVTDFGLAGLANEIQGLEVRAGTPAYMAPEQLAGREVSVRSDIYSLGLVLYEMFVGKPAYKVKSQTLAEISRMHEQGEAQPTHPSQVVEGIDDAVERVILRCLEREPSQRPNSALAVAAALPGGDPLAAALAAGETPSPEMVAAAGERGELRPLHAWICLAVIAAGLAIGLPLWTQTTGAAAYRQLSADYPPEVLASRAREIIRRHGYTHPPTDSAFGFSAAWEYLQHVVESDKSPQRWGRLPTGRPPVLMFWYRQSPRYLEPETFGFGIGGGRVTEGDPDHVISGMVRVRLDGQGRLLRFEAVPPQLIDSAPEERETDWSALFSDAGLDETAFRRVESKWTPQVWGDERLAWEGTFPDLPGVPLRIEAAGFQGNPVYWEIIYPWTRAARLQPQTTSTAQRTAQVILMVLFLSILGGSALLARRNLRLGRGDRRGATRLAGYAFGVILLSWVLGGKHVPAASELWLFILTLGWGLCVCGLFWILYLALEPYVRRRWPEGLIGWSRVLSGRFRDPRVGRDLLAGCVAGVALMVVLPLEGVLRKAMNLPLAVPSIFDLNTLLGVRHSASYLLFDLLNSVFAALALLFLFFIFRVLLRREWLAAAGVVVVISAVAALQSDVPSLTALLNALVWTALIVVLTRYGLLAVVGLLYLPTLLATWPIGSQWSAWYLGYWPIGVVLFLAVIAYAVHTALAGQSLFRDKLLQE